jgi:hypothetical protein
MALTDTERRKVLRRFVLKTFKEMNNRCDMDYDDLVAAANAVDTWMDAAQSSYNSSLPEPFKSAATLEQKALLLATMAMHKGGLLDDFLT